ncbi:hypothetical protein ACFPIJ_34705 [Dactylosporangium cerinum]|uniref:Uncharacterized protein n=1 Tax=Dactylosporangium cerinum TaxID=1434730 RepID=A0ABV9W4L1_9ACTN
MLVEIEMMRELSWSPFPIARIDTPIGRTAVPWRGAPDAPLGRHRVEWTIDTDITWGLTAKPADETGPAILAGGHCVILRGHLRLDPDGVGVLDLSGSSILLEFDELPPPDVDGTWIQIHVPHKDVHLYPYEL